MSAATETTIAPEGTATKGRADGRQDTLAGKVQKHVDALEARLAKKDAEILELKGRLASIKSSNTRVHKIPKKAPRQAADPTQV
jgi:chromosome segregation ATPase